MKINENIENKTLKEKIDVYFEKFIQMPEIAEALVLLDKLPKDLVYHNKDHTLDVLKETILFCLSDDQEEEIIKHQVIAAAWHDVGFIESKKNNEPIAVKLFEQSETYKKLPDVYKIEIINSILDTQIIIVDSSPNLSQIRSMVGYMLDADVSNFGREDFNEKRMKVAEEQNVDLKNIDERKKFDKFLIDLLKNHNWKTDSAKKLRQEQKEINLKLLEKEYSKL
jgi:adenylate cyclase